MAREHESFPSGPSGKIPDYPKLVTLVNSGRVPMVTQLWGEVDLDIHNREEENPLIKRETVKYLLIIPPKGTNFGDKFRYFAMGTYLFKGKDGKERQARNILINREEYKKFQSLMKDPFIKRIINFKKKAIGFDQAGN